MGVVETPLCTKILLVCLTQLPEVNYSRHGKNLRLGEDHDNDHLVEARTFLHSLDICALTSQALLLKYHPYEQ